MASLEYDIESGHKVYELSKKCETIGRGSEADVQFEKDPEMSRRHCSILMQDGGIFLLRDDGATNGTYLNDQLLDTGTPIPLKDGDELHLGKTFLTFHK